MLAAIEWRWDWVLFLAFALAGFARPTLRWLKRRAAEQWPTTQGRIESVDVHPTKTFIVTSSPSGRASSYTEQLAVAPRISEPPTVSALRAADRSPSRRTCFSNAMDYGRTRDDV